MKLDVQFEVEPVLLISDSSFTNKSMLNGSRLLFFGNQIPEHLDGEDKEDKLLNWLCDQTNEVLEHEDVPFIVVQQNLLAPSYKNSGIRLVSHIRLSKNEKLNQLPIVILTDRANDQLFPKSQQDWEELAPLYSKGVRFTPENDKERRYSKNDSLLIQEVEKLYGELTRDGKNEVDLFEFTDPEKPAIPTAKPEGSNHQLTNDWGAYRLIQAAGLPPSHEYRNHLYFTYLQRSSKEPNPVDKKLFKDKISLNLNVLLIDDNYKKGWKNSIEEILNKCLLSEGYKATVDPLEYANSILPFLEERNGKREIDKYDVVYLDLRLPESENNRNNPLPEQGMRVLNAIKEANPTIPVIMFTASTKATNMDDLYELGVDGYFVKEFPETRIDADFSKKNLEGFIKTTRNCLQKGALLQPYWKRVREISKNNLIRGNERKVNSQNTKFEKRIIERLTMVIGLLKKAYEQTSFDQDTFFYDHYETAFLTLWSCLNDFSEFYFEKDQPIIRLSNGIQRTYLNTIYKKHYRWSLDGDIFIEYDYEQNNRGQQITTLEFDAGKREKYKIVPSYGTTVNNEQILHSQIAFIMLKKFGASQDISLLDILFHSNKIRNSLVLTHSSDSTTGNTNITLQELRKTNQLNINALNQLFILVYLLSKGIRLQTI